MEAVGSQKSRLRMGVEGLQPIERQQAAQQQRRDQPAPGDEPARQQRAQGQHQDGLDVHSSNLAEDGFAI